MTIQQFRDATAHLPGHTLLGYLSPWGELTPAAIADPDALAEDDPVKPLITADIIVIESAEPHI